MSTEKYLAIDVGGTAIKYAITDKNAEINKIHDILDVNAILYEYDQPLLGC